VREASAQYRAYKDRITRGQRFVKRIAAMASIRLGGNAEASYAHRYDPREQLKRRTRQAFLREVRAEPRGRSCF